MIKKIILSLMLMLILISFYTSINSISNYTNNLSNEYFIRNSIIETGSKNIVTAIYLDYRLFDSIFEAGILLITVSGIIFISKGDDKVI